MKKINFLSGLGAKLAFAAIALSGAMLTGCTEDAGVDVNVDVDEPVVDLTTSYTVTGSVMDADTKQPVSATITATGAITGSATGSNYAFTTDALSGSSVVVSVKADGYEAQSREVKVASITSGAAVYTADFYMSVEKELAKYDIVVKAIGPDGKEVDVEATVSPAATAVEGGTEVTVEIAASEAYKAFTAKFTLPKEMVKKGTASQKYEFVANLVAADKSYITAMFVNQNGEVLEVTSAELYKDGVAVANSKQNNTTTYQFAVTDLNAKYTLKVIYDGKETEAEVTPNKLETIKITVAAAPGGTTGGEVISELVVSAEPAATFPAATLLPTGTTKPEETVSLIKDETKTNTFINDTDDYFDLTVKFKVFSYCETWAYWYTPATKALVENKLGSIEDAVIGAGYTDAATVAAIVDDIEKYLLRQGFSAAGKFGDKIERSVVITMAPETCFTVTGIEQTQNAVAYEFVLENGKAIVVIVRYSGDYKVLGTPHSIKHDPTHNHGAHSHNHGHGSDNAGGGIIVAE